MTQIQFIHRRPVVIIGPARPADFASRGGFTVAYQEVQPGLIEYSVAHCSPRDNFNKKIGRDIATGRLINGRHLTSRKSSIEAFREYMYAAPM